jgi:hypothetical protein
MRAPIIKNTTPVINIISSRGITVLERFRPYIINIPIRNPIKGIPYWRNDIINKKFDFSVILTRFPTLA